MVGARQYSSVVNLNASFWCYLILRLIRLSKNLIVVLLKRCVTQVLETGTLFYRSLLRNDLSSTTNISYTQFRAHPIRTAIYWRACHVTLTGWCKPKFHTFGEGFRVQISIVFYVSL